MTKTTKTAKPAAAKAPRRERGASRPPKRSASSRRSTIRREGRRKSAAKAGKAKVATTKPAPAPKAATASAKPATEGVKAPTGAKGKIIAMIDASKAGVSPGEIAKALGWPRAGGTISRAIKLAPFKVAKARDAEGVLALLARLSRSSGNVPGGARSDPRPSCV